jgi:hypothetical protein
MVKLFVRALLIVGLLSILSVSGFAQTGSGEIRGTVTDSNGAAIPGASVEVTNDNTGEKQTVTSNDAGVYVVPQLKVGTYTVVANQTGFASATVKSVSVSVAFSSETNLTLNAGGGVANVTIQSGDSATTVNTNDQQLSTLLDNKKILDLPLLNRDPNSLVLLAPGATQTTSGLGGFSINGSRERNNNFLVDGVDNNDTEVPGIPGGVATPNIDATQEFRVVTGSFNADLGRNTGGIISVATKGGTNDFHGGTYIYYRSDRFAARNFFDTTGAADPLQQKQFGASIGGPIRKDKAFFFFNYEGERQSLGSEQVRLVPSANARLGILNTPAPRPGCPQCVGTIDINELSPNNKYGFPVNPAVLAILNRIYPLPNGDLSNLINGVVPGALDTYAFGYTQKNTTNSIATRVDYRFNSKHSFTGSYNYNTGRFDVGAETFPGLGDTIITPQRSSLVSLTLVSTFSPTLVNEAHFGLNRLKANFYGTGDNGVPNTLFDAINSAFNAQGYPLAAPFGGANGQRIDLLGTGITGLGGFDSQRRFTGTTSAGDSITWVKGNHTFKMGGEFRWVYSNSDTNFGRGEEDIFSYPTLTGDNLLLDNMGNPINPLANAGTGALNNYASFYYALVVEQTQSQYFNKAGARTNNDFRGFRTREWDVYGQDQWKIRSNLTLNLGLRYEKQGVPYEVNGQLSTLVNQDPSGFEPVGGFRFSLVGKGNAGQLYLPDNNNFAPRFGFNYSPAFTHGLIAKLTGGPEKTSIRGGYGVYYDRIFGNLFSNSRGNPPFQQDFFDIPEDTLDNINRPPTQNSSPVVPGDAEIFPNLFALPGNNQFQKKFAIPYEQKWSFGFQRSFGNDLLLEADYFGGKGTDELRVIDGQLTSDPRVSAVTGVPTPIVSSLTSNILNGRLNDAFFQVALNLADGFSTYNSLQTRLSKRLTNTRFGTGTFEVAYTWSHSIDNATDGLVAQPGERSFPRDSSGFAGGFNERGNSGFDVRHRVVANFDYDLPFKFDNRWMEKAFGGFTLAGIFSIQSGVPYSIFGNRDSQGTGLSGRADYGNGTNNLLVSSLPPDPRTQTGPVRQMFGNPCPADAHAVVNPTTGATTCPGTNLIGRQGSTGRNTFRGPSFNEFNLSILKHIPITEKVALRFQADFFNLFNRVNFNIPDNAINDQTFGRSLSIVGNPRIIQFAARLDF